MSDSQLNGQTGEKRQTDDSVTDITGSQTTTGAVGLVVTDATMEQTARAVLRAAANEYPVFVISSTIVDPETERFVEQLDGTVIDSVQLEDPLALEETLVAIGESHDFSHIITHTDLTQRIDYERTADIIHSSASGAVEPVFQADPSVSPSIVAGIPAYNEAGTIADVVTETAAYVDEVIVVDDASQDNTVTLADDAGATVVEHDQNQGYGGALNTIFDEAAARNADHLVILDGDGQHDSSDIPELVQVQQESEAEIVIGSRFTEDATTEFPLYRRFGLFIVNSLTNLSMGVFRRQSWVKDTQCGFRIYNEPAIESLSKDDSIGSNMSASTDILYHGHEHGYEFKEVGTTVDYDVEDPSSHSPVSHGLTLVSNILQTVERKHPILILGGPGFLSAFIGLGFGYWTFSNYISSGTFPIGSAVVSASFVLAGIFTCFTGIILHSLNQDININ